MSLYYMQYVGVQCDWQTDDGSWFCTNIEKFRDPSADSHPLLPILPFTVEQLRILGYSFFLQNGWSIGEDGRHRCPDCVGRRTDTRERDDDFEEESEDAT